MYKSRKRVQRSGPFPEVTRSGAGSRRTSRGRVGVDHEGTGRANGRGRGNVASVGRSGTHGGDGRELAVLSGTAVTGAGEADGHGGDELAATGSDDEPDARSDGSVRVGDVVVDALTGSEEETEVEAEGDDGGNKGQDSRQAGNDSHNEMRAQGEEEGNGRQSGADGGEDESDAETVDDGSSGTVGTGQGREEVAVVAQLR